MSTGIGIIAGFGLLLTAIFMGGGLRVFLNLEAVMITMGGTLAATLISYPFERVLNFFALVMQLFREEHQRVFEQTVSRLVALGQKASKDTIFSLEKEAKDEKSRYLKAGIQLLVQDAPASRISKRFNIEVEGVRSRHQEGIQLFGFMSRIAPSLGLVGTIIGMINMLRGMAGDVSPETLGPNMAVALVCTLYGCLLAFVLFLPASEKLKAYSTREQALIHMIQEGLLLIRDGRTGREMEETLNSYLPPRRRQAIVEKILLGGIDKKK
ncbi:MAG TPA: MotA/TolQ/ExbB proton channel family protein [Syntrophobacteraceae bacterium]|nr:MotA/TolQ/ExbB proton channel family protein [Syntrophobacteraceae bacterium]